MKKIVIYALFLTFPSTIFAQKDFKPLFNGKDLTGWEKWLGKPSKNLDIQGLTKDADGKYTQLLGLNNDPTNVFTVVQEDGQAAIRVSGQIWGGINTLVEFEDFHLKLQFKWGKTKVVPDSVKRDSGLLYYCVGPQGVMYGHWMESHECQIQEGDCGDLWVLKDALADVSSKQFGEKKYIYDPQSPMNTFGQNEPKGPRCYKSANYEKPTGEWNTMEVIAKGDKIQHIVNSHVVLELTHSRRLVNGQTLPLTKGKIQLQSEGAEIFFRGVEIKSL